MNDSIFQQSKDNPSFPKLLWSKPENKNNAGRILIVGGSLNHFNLVSKAYILAHKEIIRECIIALPDSLKNNLFRIIPEAHFLASNSSGGFSKKAETDIKTLIQHSDHSLIVGDLGNNSETQILIDNLLENSTQNFTFNDYTINFLLNMNSKILNRGNLNLVINFTNLQKLMTLFKLEEALVSTMNLSQFNSLLSKFTSRHNISILTNFESFTIYSYQSKVGYAKTGYESVELSTKSSIWIMHNPEHIFEALACAVYEKL